MSALLAVGLAAACDGAAPSYSWAREFNHRTRENQSIFIDLKYCNLKYCKTKASSYSIVDKRKKLKPNGNILIISSFCCLYSHYTISAQEKKVGNSYCCCCCCYCYLSRKNKTKNKKPKKTSTWNCKYDYNTGLWYFDSSILQIDWDIGWQSHSSRHHSLRIHYTLWHSKRFWKHRKYSFVRAKRRKWKTFCRIKWINTSGR